MPSARSDLLSPEEIIATLNRLIERYKAMAIGSHHLGAEHDAAEAFAMIARLRKVRDDFQTWFAAKDKRQPPQTGQVVTFRRLNQGR